LQEVELLTSVVLNGSTITGSVDDFDAEALTALSGVLSVDEADASISDVSVSDASQPQRRSLLEADASSPSRALLEDCAGESVEVVVSYKITVPLDSGADSNELAAAITAILKLSVTNGEIDEKLSASSNSVLACSGIQQVASLAAIAEATFVVVVAPAPTPAPTAALTAAPTAAVPCSSDADCTSGTSGSCALPGRRRLKGGGAFPRAGVCVHGAAP
jgi:hypothetical protein